MFAVHLGGPFHRNRTTNVMMGVGRSGRLPGWQSSWKMSVRCGWSRSIGPRFATPSTARPRSCCTTCSSTSTAMTRWPWRCSPAATAPSAQAPTSRRSPAGEATRSTTTHPSEIVGSLGPMGPTRLLLDKPVIAAVEGHAVAGGLELACWADLRVAAADAVFGVYCRRWGVPLVDGGTIRLTRLIGHSRALDLMLTGRGVDGVEAERIGLANRVVGSGEALGGGHRSRHRDRRAPTDLPALGPPVELRPVVARPGIGTVARDATRTRHDLLGRDARRSATLCRRRRPPRQPRRHLNATHPISFAARSGWPVPPEVRRKRNGRRDGGRQAGCGISSRRRRVLTGIGRALRRCNDTSNTSNGGHTRWRR